MTQSIVCCYPVTGKPTTDFTVHGLLPEYNDGSYPSNCDPITHSSKQLRDERIDFSRIVEPRLKLEETSKLTVSLIVPSVNTRNAPFH